MGWKFEHLRTRACCTHIHIHTRARTNAHTRVRARAHTPTDSPPPPQKKRSLYKTVARLICLVRCRLRYWRVTWHWLYWFAMLIIPCCIRDGAQSYVRIKPPISLSVLFGQPTGKGGNPCSVLGIPRIADGRNRTGIDQNWIGIEQNRSRIEQNRPHERE